MSLQFCPVCRALLLLRYEDGKNIGYCNCGFKRMSGIEITSTDDHKESVLRLQGVANNSVNLEINNEGVYHLCKKCGNDKAELLELNAHNINESMIYVYKCLKCEYKERTTGGRNS